MAAVISIISVFTAIIGLAFLHVAYCNNDVEGKRIGRRLLFAGVALFAAVVIIGG